MIFRLSDQRSTYDLDHVSDILVRASSAAEARERAAGAAGDEGQAVWLDERRSTCEAVAPDGPAAVLAVVSKGF